MTVKIIIILLQLSKSNREAYCRLHGYPLIDGTDTFLKGRRNPSGGLAYFSWLKIEFVCAMMGKHDHLNWLFWMDTDALFMNIHISLVQLLAGVEKDDLMILAQLHLTMKVCCYGDLMIFVGRLDWRFLKDSRCFLLRSRNNFLSSCHPAVEVQIAKSMFGH